MKPKNQKPEYFNGPDPEEEPEMAELPPGFVRQREVWEEIKRKAHSKSKRKGVADNE